MHGVPGYLRTCARYSWSPDDLAVCVSRFWGGSDPGGTQQVYRPVYHSARRGGGSGTVITRVFWGKPCEMKRIFLATVTLHAFWYRSARVGRVRHSSTQGRSSIRATTSSFRATQLPTVAAYPSPRIRVQP